MSNSLLKVSRPEQGVLQVQINRPKVLNALNTEVLTQIADELSKVAEDPQLRVVVLTGDSRAFAAGADIGELQQAASGDFPEAERQKAWSTIRAFPKPLIAAVSGFALGGGCELMMAADIIVASRNTQIGQPEINLGIIPGAGGTQLLTRAIGKAASMKLNLTGAFISAREALDLGAA
ncbi:MAG: enoyl-CoA hydratase/isomerase family protein [Arenicella sp.]|nr:enoyl-CoA hydratase/isomerase family protein [Arenicella sp.]